MELTKRYSIAYKGLKNGLHDFDFEVDKELFSINESAEIKGGTCHVHVSLKHLESLLEVNTVIDGSVLVACDRCLEDFDLPIHFEGRLVVKISDQSDDYDGEVLWLSPSLPELDLTQYIYESIVLSLPFRRVHPDGVCDPDMLKRFNIVSDAEFAAIEARAEAEAAAMQRELQGDEWGKLEALREVLKHEDGQTVNKSIKKDK